MRYCPCWRNAGAGTAWKARREWSLQSLTRVIQTRTNSGELIDLPASTARNPNQRLQQVQVTGGELSFLLSVLAYVMLLQHILIYIVRRVTHAWGKPICI